MHDPITVANMDPTQNLLQIDFNMLGLEQRPESLLRMEQSEEVSVAELKDQVDFVELRDNLKQLD